MFAGEKTNFNGGEGEYIFGCVGVLAINYIHSYGLDHNMPIKLYLSTAAPIYV